MRRVGEPLSSLTLLCGVSELHPSVDVRGDDECWPWTGQLDYDGYGKLGIYNKDTGKYKWHRAHRYSYELLIGQIPDDLVIDHKCRNRTCCNPAHLEPVTIAENNRRSVAYHFGKQCKREHQLTEDNIYVSPKGVRNCKQCNRDRAAKWARDKRRMQHAS